MANVMPINSCRSCKYKEKPVGADPCLECIARWTEEPASKWEEQENDDLCNN